MGQAKAKIDLMSGQIELEGSEEFVSKHLALVEKLIASRITTQAVRPNGPASGSQTIFETSGTQPITEVDQESTKAHIRKSPPTNRTGGGKRVSGTGYPTRIAKLRDDGFFSQRRDIASICSELSRKGFPNKTQPVGAALHSLVKSNKLERTKDGGQWQYLWPSDRT